MLRLNQIQCFRSQFQNFPSEKFWSCEQKHCIEFCRAAKIDKNNCVQPKILQLRTSTVFWPGRAENSFGIIRPKSTALCSARSGKFGIYQQKQLKVTVFCSATHRQTLDFANKNNSN
jgi:hypothetical protein